MDHAINALMDFYRYEVDAVANELQSGAYRKLTDTPSYAAAKALQDAIHRLERYYFGKTVTLSVRQLIEYRGLL